MAADDFDGLPMYVEDDEEEAAVAKQKRRKLPWEKLYEYDPKLGHGCYNRVWFVDFSTLDIDEETQHGPMRFTDSHSLIGDDHDDSLNVLCLKIRSSDADYPVNVYGTVIVRDRLDMKCIYIFRRNRNNCQVLESEGESLILTGPTRGIVFSCDAYFETNLKIKENKESEDRQFSKAMIDVDIAKVVTGVQTRTIFSWLSEMDLTFAYVKKALEGTIEIAILSGSDVFNGKITVCTTDVPNHILLYDSDVHAPSTWGNDRVIQLLRRVVTVSADQMLIFHFYPCSDGNPKICKFTPQIKGADKAEIPCGVDRLCVKVTWSVVSVRI